MTFTHKLIINKTLFLSVSEFFFHNCIDVRAMLHDCTVTFYASHTVHILTCNMSSNRCTQYNTIIYTSWFV